MTNPNTNPREIQRRNSKEEKNRIFCFQKIISFFYKQKCVTKNMIAQHFSRADASLLAEVAAIQDDDLHYPISERQLIEFIERATARSAFAEVQKFRSQLPPEEYHTTDGKNGRLSLRAAIQLSAALRNTFDIPVIYLQEVLTRVASDCREDDRRCWTLLKRCSEFVAKAV